MYGEVLSNDQLEKVVNASSYSEMLHNFEESTLPNGTYIPQNLGKDVYGGINEVTFHSNNRPGGGVINDLLGVKGEVNLDYLSEAAEKNGYEMHNNSHSSYIVKTPDPAMGMFWDPPVISVTNDSPEYMLTVRGEDISAIIDDYVKLVLK